MIQIVTVTLVASGVLSVAAVASFSWSIAAARLLLMCASAIAALGALAVGLSGGHSGLEVWAFLFACGSCGCGVTAMRNLFTRPTRWVHRFVIYAGYGATFAAMGAMGIWLAARAASGWLAAGVFLGVYVVGSAGIFLAKTLIVRRAVKTMPEYHASLIADPRGPNDQGYW